MVESGFATLGARSILERPHAVHESPLVSVITPVYNGGRLIRSTVESVLRQSYSRIEYIVIDGGSSDDTVEVVRSCGPGIAELISEPDGGVYDALVKGFHRARGEIVCYINAGDFLYPHAIQVAVDLLGDAKNSWITGCRSVCNEANVVTSVDLPFRYKTSLIRSGSYGRALPFIQQESTFWRASLLKAVNMDFLRRLKLAGDYYLWWSFSDLAQLEVVSSPLGVFKKHAGQLSDAMEEYFREVRTFTGGRGPKERCLEFIELCFWALNPRIRSSLIDSVFRFDHRTGAWRKGHW